MPLNKVAVDVPADGNSSEVTVTTACLLNADAEADAECLEDKHESRPTCDSESKHQRSAYKEYPWLEKVTGGYICSFCKTNGIITKQNQGAWITEPIKQKSSKKLLEKAEKLAQSASHRFAQAAAKQSCGSSVVTQIHLQANAQKVNDNEVMKSLFRAAYFTFHCEISHTTTWRDLISTISACDFSSRIHTTLSKCPANAHHLSTTSVTGILEAFGAACEDVVRRKVQSCQFFSVMADECTDINGKENVSVCVRVFVENRIEEVFLGCWKVDSTKASDIHQCILSALNHYGLKAENLVAAAFDGASNMSGKHSGVQALLKQSAPYLVFVHCRSHLLQLALVRAAASVVHIKRVLATVNKLYTLFRNSPLKLTVLQKAQEAIDGTVHKLVQPGETRWLSYDGSVAVVMKHYGAICIALESIYTGAGDWSCEAGGYARTAHCTSCS